MVDAELDSPDEKPDLADQTRAGDIGVNQKEHDVAEAGTEASGLSSGRQDSGDALTNGLKSEAQPRRKSGPGLVKTLFGTKKKLALWISGVVVLALVVGGGVTVSNYLEMKAEEKATAIKQFEDEAAAYSGQVSSLTAGIADAKKLLSSTPAEKVADKAVLTDLEAAIEEASDALKKNQVEVLENLEEQSTEEIIGRATDLNAASEPLGSEYQALLGMVSAVEASVDAKRIADEEAAKQAQIAAAGPIAYEELARGADSLFGNYYRFEGQVIQDAGSGTYRVSITRDPGYSRDFWKDPILILIDGDAPQRILEDDLISFVGSSMGMKSYESIFGQEISVPLVFVEGQNVAVIGRVS